MTQKQLLVSTSTDGEITTSPLTGLRADDTIVVQYTYTIKDETTSSSKSLELLLQSSDESIAPSFGQPNDMDNTISPTRRPTTHGSVWVEWVGAKPARVANLPKNVVIERDARAIAGLSLESPALQPGEKFQLAWAM
jgi:hypothetical protein